MVFNKLIQKLHPKVSQFPKDLLFVGAFAGIGVVLLYSSRAATPSASIEPESGRKVNVATTQDSGASGNYAVTFGTATAPSGWPDENNTGVPAGTTLRSCPAPITSSGTYDACLWSNGLTVAASNVLITNSKIVGRLDIRSTNITVESTEIDGNRMPGAAIGNLGFTGRKLKVHNAQMLVWSGPNLLLEDSYFNNIWCTGSSHCGGITGTGIAGTIRRNTIFGNLAPGSAELITAGGGVSAALTIYTHIDQSNGFEWPPINGLLIENNLIQARDGSPFSAYAGGTGDQGRAQNIRYINNTFKRISPGKASGGFGNITSFHAGYGNLIDGNKYDTGESIPENSWDGNGL